MSITKQKAKDLVEEIPEQGLQLDAEGNFRFILGNKAEHDGIKIYAATPELIYPLLEDDDFQPDKYYCIVGDDEGAKFDPNELEANLDTVVSIGAIDGMLPYDAVNISAASGDIDVEDLIHSSNS